MDASSNNGRRTSDTLPPLGLSRYERATQDDQYSPHRQSHGSSAVVTPTSPTTKYASPLSVSAGLPKPVHPDYISPPESRRPSEKEEDHRNAGLSRPMNLPSLPSLGQMIDAIPQNYAPFSIVSTGNPALPGPPSLSASLSATPRPFPSRSLHDADSSANLPTSIHRSLNNHQSSPRTAPPNVSRETNSQSQTVNSHVYNNTPSFSAREGPESRPTYEYQDRIPGVKGSPRSQSSSNDHLFTRPNPPPPPPPQYTHGYEQNHPYENRPYGQISPHISAFPPPPPPPPSAHSTPNSNYPSGGQTFPGQAAALYAYQHRSNGPYGNEHGSHPETPFSPKGKSVSGKTSYQDAYGSAINRALDISELRRELDLIRDNASHLYHFSTQYTPQGGQQGGFQALKYSGQIEPSVQALDDAINITHRILEALEYWRNKVVNDQGRKHEQQMNPVKPVVKRPIDHVDDDLNYGDDMRSGLQSDPKKQRKGKAAPPGRCHSCNRAETPEWRRGPDGARTLCNACGLHYAKLTRKLNKGNTSMGPSPLARKTTSTTLM